MTKLSRAHYLPLWLLVLAAGLLATPPVIALLSPPDMRVLLDDDDDPKPKPKSKSKKKVSAATPDKKDLDDDDDDMPKVRWGQKRGETDEQYDKRYARLLKRIKQDKRGDFSDGTFDNGNGQEVRLWTYMGNPFIVRTDISKEFTADTAMYMDMLHRDYGAAYKKLLGGIASDLKGEKVEVIVFADRATYMKNGGSPGSGGFFMSFGHLVGDRGPFWPARRYRLQQFTSGVTDFRKWEKGTLKHEAAHMELQLRLGNTLFANQVGVPVDCPRWFNEGHAACFEYWDFDKTVEENFAEIPNRGRYAPVIRRIHGTEKWKDFNYVWTIDPQSWHQDMTSEQGFLNYAQAWSLAAYMMSSTKGRKDFQSIFNLSKRVGVNSQQTYKGDFMRAWTDKFPEEEQVKLEKNWNDWIGENVSRDKQVPDEDYFLKRQGYKADVTERLERYTQEEFDKLRKWLEDEEERRKESKEVER